MPSSPVPEITHRIHDYVGDQITGGAMFEITPEDIVLLNDTDLRTLVRMLAE
jgi:hypothetical protein